jgi:signal transduction histidine kinase
MKKSIFLKLLTFMMSNILIFTLLLYLANVLFASDYYVERKKALLIENAQNLNQLLLDAELPFNDLLHFEIDRIASTIGGSITIGEVDGKLYYPDRRSVTSRPLSSITRPFFQIKGNGLTLGPDKPNNSTNIKEWELIDEHSLFVVVDDPNLLIETLRYQTVLDNGLTVQFWVPMAEINESVDVSNRFTSIIALITLVITMIASVLLSKQFTKPILKMNGIAKQMLELDFTQSLNSHSADEIGQLSTTINQLSKKLHITLEELNTKNRQLELDIDKERQLDALRKSFISNVSHELKTPIFLIQGYAEGLKANIATSEAKRNFYSDVIIEEADRMDFIVKDLLDLSQLETGHFSIHKCDFDLGQLTEDIMTKLEPLLEQDQITVHLNVAPNTMTHADPIRIEQVIYNLVTNAVNHCIAPNIITLDITTALNQSHNSPVLRVKVRNTGQPIPEAALEQLWTSFYKVDDSRTRDYGGSGLGLAIVKNILTAHQQAYGVMNHEDGVTFWFELDSLA